jgi:hypothetical protein
MATQRRSVPGIMMFTLAFAVHESGWNVSLALPVVVRGQTYADFNSLSQ